MTIITIEQASERFDSLSEKLKDISCSPAIVTVIQQVSKDNHLTRDKMLILSELIGYVLFGFIHAEDLAKEIQAELSIAPEIANAIAAEIDRKIFAPIRGDLEKNYAPPVPEVTRVPAEPAVPPESIIDLKAPKVAAEAVRVPAEIPTTPEIEAEPQRVVAKEIKTAEEPAPVIIHKETEYKPTAGEAAKRSLGGIFGLLASTGKTSGIKPVAARIEMTKLEKPKEDVLKPAPTAKPEPPKIRVVHYTELRTPFSPVETPAKPLVSAPTPPIIAPAQPQKEEIKKEVSSPGVRRIETPAVDLRQSKIEPSIIPIPAKMPELPKIPEFQKATEPLGPIETPKPPARIATQNVAGGFEPLRKPEPIKPFEPVKSAEPMRPTEPPKTPEPPKPFNVTQDKSPAPQVQPKTEEKKLEKPDEGDTIDLRTFQKIKGSAQKLE